MSRRIVLVTGGAGFIGSNIVGQLTEGGLYDVVVCDRLRAVLPTLLALSATSPYLDARDAGLHSARTQSFTKSFPRCGIPDSFGSWAAYREYVDFLVRTDSIVEYTQVWWSIRPHFSFGTVEVRICDAQATAREADAPDDEALEEQEADPPAHRLALELGVPWALERDEGLCDQTFDLRLQENRAFLILFFSLLLSRITQCQLANELAGNIVNHFIRS